MRYVCKKCGCEFEYNIDGCPSCGCQDIHEREQ